MTLEEDNLLLNLLVEAVAIIPLNTIEFGRLSTNNKGLKYLLFYTHEKEKFFATLEYEVFRYSTILAAKQVSDDAFKTFTNRLPSIEQTEDSIQVKNEFTTDIQKVIKELEPLIEFIDFITSLGTRGIPYDFDYVWDKSACGSKLIIEHIVSAPNSINSYQGIRAKVTLIEKDYKPAWVGLCSSEHHNFEAMSTAQTIIWVLSSTGYCFNSGKGSNYCQPFGDGAKVIVHLDMNKRTCAFTINGKKYPEVSGWNNLPSKLHPLVTLRYPGRYDIEFNLIIENN
ncbi:hypothetical protein GLOIN_2v1523309 [Rhizophagus clarus]|nr:hypothetical protein GLOIN_2v1523309 [Rhizophagus clarus]